MIMEETKNIMTNNKENTDQLLLWIYWGAVLLAAMNNLIMYSPCRLRKNKLTTLLSNFLK